MRLDPNHRLAPQTVLAMLDAMRHDAQEVPDVSDRDLLALALGVADERTRVACAEAILAHGETSVRLRSVLARVAEGLEPGPSAEALSDAALLRAFEGAFDAEDAAAVYPDRFGADPGRLEVLGSLRLLIVLPSGRFAATSGEPPNPTASEAWVRRYVEHYARLVRRLDALLAEGRWTAASSRLRDALPNVRAAWRRASTLGMQEDVESMARALVPALIEMDERDALRDLVAAGYLAAESLGRPSLRSRLLNYEGVALARWGEAERARELWLERVFLNRSVGNPVAEADALIDLATQRVSEEDWAGWREIMPAAEKAAIASGRVDFLANLDVLRGLERLAAGDAHAAAARAEAALAAIGSVASDDGGLFVRIYSAQILRRSGRSVDSMQALAPTLALCVEAGRPLHAAHVLEALSETAEAGGDLAFAVRCLAVAEGLHRAFGSRHAGRIAEALALLRDRAGDVVEAKPQERGWEADARSILDRIADLCRQRDPERKIGPANSAL